MYRIFGVCSIQPFIFIYFLLACYAANECLCKYGLKPAAFQMTFALHYLIVGFVLPTFHHIYKLFVAESMGNGSLVIAPACFSH